MDKPTQTAYGVWIRGKGWLRNAKGDFFADLSREVALGAASFFGDKARVVPFDDAMGDLESKFIDGERTWSETLWLNVRAWFNNLKRFAHNAHNPRAANATATSASTARATK